MLNLSRVGATELSMPHLSACLKTKKLLLKLMLDNNRIGEEGAKLLAEGLAGGDALTHLTLSNSSI